MVGPLVVLVVVAFLLVSSSSSCGGTGPDGAVAADLVCGRPNKPKRRLSTRERSFVVAYILLRRQSSRRGKGKIEGIPEEIAIQSGRGRIQKPGMGRRTMFTMD